MSATTPVPHVDWVWDTVKKRCLRRLASQVPGHEDTYARHIVVGSCVHGIGFHTDCPNCTKQELKNMANGTRGAWFKR